MRTGRSTEKAPPAPLGRLRSATNGWFGKAQLQGLLFGVELGQVLVMSRPGAIHADHGCAAAKLTPAHLRYAASTRHGGAIVAKFDRITSIPSVLNGQPTIRGMRLSVRRVIEALAVYPDWDDLRREYPDLEPEDIRQALEFAAHNLDDSVEPLEAA